VLLGGVASVLSVAWIARAVADESVSSTPLSPFDFDRDGDIDLRDFAAFQDIYDLDYLAVFLANFTGPLDFEAED
jgi:hypothetical protein